MQSVLQKYEERQSIYIGSDGVVKKGSDVAGRDKDKISLRNYVLQNLKPKIED